MFFIILQKTKHPKAYSKIFLTSSSKFTDFNIPGSWANVVANLFTSVFDKLAPAPFTIFLKQSRPCSLALIGETFSGSLSMFEVDATLDIRPEDDVEGCLWENKPGPLANEKPGNSPKIGCSSKEKFESRILEKYQIRRNFASSFN